MLNITYCQIHGSIDTEGSLFGWEGFPCSHDEIWVACARFLPTDELCILLTPKSCVVGLTQGQKVWSQVACNHLPSIYKDICSKESKCINSWGTKKTNNVSFLLFKKMYSITIQYGNILEIVMHSVSTCTQFFPFYRSLVSALAFWSS